MSLKHTSALLVGLGLVICTGLVLAQAPDQGPAAAAGRRGPGGGMGWQPMGGFSTLLGGGEGTTTKLANTAKGVDVTLTAAKAEDVGKLQDSVQQDVMNLQQMRERMAQQAGNAPRAPQGGRGGMALLFSEDVNVTTKKIDNGVVISLTSDKPEVVQQLQQSIPQMVEMRTRMEQARQAAALLANPDVKMEVKQTDSGITVTYTSTNPDLAKQIQEKLPAYLEQQKEFARNAAQWQGMGMMGAGMPGARGGAGGAAGAGAWRGRRGAAPGGNQ
jgi:uncharacterized alkaline shock family protein YloU